MSMMRGLAAESYDREYSDRQLVRRIATYFAPERARMAVVVGALVTRSLLSAAVSVIVARGVDQMASGAFPTLAVATVIGLGIATWGLNWIQRSTSAKMIGDVVLRLRDDAFSSAMRHDMNFYDQYQSGRIVSRITSDTDEFGRVAVLITDLASQFLLAIALLVILARIDARLTLILIVLAPLALVVASSFRTVARRLTQRSQRAVAEVNVSIQEAVTGISVAKNFRREQGVYDQFRDVNALSYDANVRRGFIFSLIFPTLNLLSGLGTAVLLYFGGVSALAGTISLGNWYLFMNSVSNFWFPMTNLAAFWSQFQAGLSATERLFGLMDAEPVVRQSATEPVNALEGDIRFENVTFGYRDREPVLCDFSLHIQPGESVALVGHTGAGKSSIAKLVTRFYEFQEGTLEIDGHDIRTLDLAQYRRRLGIVSQSPFLFEGTVADNIRYGAPPLSDAEVARVARQVGEEWLETLPHGLESDVGERGSRLSMGQRQLVVLARMMAQDPAIFILDEATASVDPFTEAQIQQALERLFAQRTSIIIAHRLSTVRAADRILVLDHGRIIEEGSHDALMARGGHYADLYDTYFRHQSLDYIEKKGEVRAQMSGVR